MRRALVLLLVIAAVAGCGTTAPTTPPERPEFPRIDRPALSDPQRRIIDTLEQQFALHPPGVTYSEGVDEPWCADFVSWVMNASGQPLVNPNSGHWRIPGVYTLQEYYRSVDRWQPPQYRPDVGDVVLWDEGSPLGLHANVVIAVEESDGLALTTVGGNEEGGIGVRTTTVGPETLLLGYGVLAR